MAFAGKSEKKEHVTAAIAANIWMSYENNSKAAMEDDPLNLIVLNCEVGGADSHVTNTVHLSNHNIIIYSTYISRV